MLIRFNIKNFLSFSEREDGKSEEFSMIAGKVRNKKEHIYSDDKIKLLKFAAVYGANASGKSNLVKALEFMKQVVLFGLPEGYTDKYCKVIGENKEKESYFELELMLENKYYAYGFEVILNKGKIVSEWLIELTSDNREKVIFPISLISHYMHILYLQPLTQEFYVNPSHKSYPLFSICFWPVSYWM